MVQPPVFIYKNIFYKNHQDYVETPGGGEGTALAMCCHVRQKRISGTYYKRGQAIMEN